MGLSPKVYNQIRGKGAYIPQGNSSGFNPLMRIGTQIAESLRIHLKLGRAEAHTYAVDALRNLISRSRNTGCPGIRTNSAAG